MNNQTNADLLHAQVVVLRMQGKTTEELLEIWQENDTQKWANEDLDAARKILMERTGKLPEQKTIKKSDAQLRLTGQVTSSEGSENLLFLILMNSVLFGLAMGGAFNAGSAGLYQIPGAGVFGGTIGGIIAGVSKAFSWRTSKTTKTALSSILIVLALLSVVSGAIIIAIFAMLPGVVSFFIGYFFTVTAAKQLTKTPVNWWLFGLLLVFGSLITILANVFLADFSALFMAQ